MLNEWHSSCVKEPMERILVPVGAGEKDIRVIIHGLQLAGRIGGLVYVLEIARQVNGMTDTSVLIPKPVPLSQRPITAKTFKEDIQCEYFQVKGDFCAEVMHFCLQKQITTLVLEIAPASRLASPSSLLQMISSLQAKKICQVELIGKK